MIHFNNAWIIRRYPISPRTQCTIASTSKSITNNNPHLPAAKEEEEEEGRDGIFPLLQSPCCLHHPIEKDSHASPVLDGFASIQDATDSGTAGVRIPSPNWEQGAGLPRDKGSSWRCSTALPPCVFMSRQAALQQWELTDREGKGRLILTRM